MRALFGFPTGRVTRPVDSLAAFLCLGFPPNKKNDKTAHQEDFGLKFTLITIHY
jgi:hypothetical protein